MAGTADEPMEALESIREALRGLRFGAVTAIVHDGVVVQVERTEKLRLPKGVGIDIVSADSPAV